MNKLNPCPFCGGQAIMKIQKHIPNGYDYTPTCQNPSCAGRLTKGVVVMKKTLDEVIKAYEICMSDESKTTNCKGCPYADESGEPKCYGDDKEDALHYLEAYRQLSQGLVSENTEIRPEGIYCKVCGTRLDKDWDDENAR